MIIYELPTGERVAQRDNAIIIPFKTNKRVMSTGPLNGGYREDIKYVFNKDLDPNKNKGLYMKDKNYEDFMKDIAENIGLNWRDTTGLGTSVSMENMAIVEESYKGLIVTALVTGGIEKNGGRIGEPASLVEEDGKFKSINPGTINIILDINVDLSKSALTRAMVTCTEAKTAAIQELLIGSKYSSGISTGSGTDGTIIMTNRDSNIRLTETGKHYKIGELIGKAVKNAVKEALYLHTDVSPRTQFNLFRRMGRFGIDRNVVWEFYNENYKGDITEENFLLGLEELCEKEELVIPASLYAHLLDQLNWGLIDDDMLIKGGISIVNRIREVFDMENVDKDLYCRKLKEKSDEDITNNMVKILMITIIDIVIKNY